MTMRSYHWLREDMTASSGDEPAWTVGEQRTIEGELVLCRRGYHSSPTLYDGLEYAQGNVACLVEIDTVFDSDDTAGRAKQVSRARKLLAAVNVERELRLWGCDCAERALLRERERGREPDAHSWEAIAVTRRYADGHATKAELAAAGAAAGAAAWAAAWAAEIAWQRQRFDEVVTARLLAALSEGAVTVEV